MSRGRYEIFIPNTDQFVDVLMTMGLKGLFQSSGSDLLSVVCYFMRIYDINFDRFLR